MLVVGHRDRYGHLLSARRSWCATWTDHSVRRDNAPFLGGCEPARQLSLQPVVAVGADDEGNDPRTCSVATEVNRQFLAQDSHLMGDDAFHGVPKQETNR